MRLQRISPPCLVALAVLICTTLPAQQPAAIARINSPVDDAVRITLKGNVPYLARAQYDHGEAEASTQLTHMRLVLSRTPEQEAELQKYLADLQDKSSPNYHRWLTPAQFGLLYGQADSDTAVLVAWLESHGLKIETIAPGRTNIAFSGTVGQAEEAFHTPIHSFVFNGEQFYSNIKDPQIPAALATVIKGVAHLNTIRPKSYAVRGEPGVSNPESKRLEPIRVSAAERATPLLTVGSGTSDDPYFLYMVPGDAATIYDTPNPKFNANFTTGTTYNGTGVKIGIGGDALILGATVADYRTKFVGDSNMPTITNVDGVSTGGGALDEAYIDTELSGGLAPGASIYFYTSTDLLSAIDKAINDNKVDIFSLSFGDCELDLSTADNAMFNAWWQQAATQGIAVTVSTGDSGSAGCDATTTSSGTNVTDAVDGVAVNGFASTPYNIAVGGTDLSGLATSFSTYASTSEGTSATLYRTALGYIPESTWNDSTTVNTTISADVPWTAISADAGYANISAGSGGVSNCSTNTTVDTSTTYTIGKCTSGYAKPSWQRGTGVPADSSRDLPDVALMSGNGFNPATWLICSDDTTQNSSGATVTENCTKQSDGSFYFVGYGGTSTAAPAFAGILALVQQMTGGRLGQAAKNLYDLYNGANASAIFHDVTVGNNSVPCTAATPNCTKNSAGYDYLIGYNTNTGYDLATGLGSVDAKQLVNFWSSSTGTTAPTLTITPSSTAITSTTALTVAVTLSGTGALGTPTGTVTLSGGGYTSASQPLTAGAYTFSIPAGTLAVGTDTLTVAYSGDVNYASISGTTSVTVTGLTPTVTLTPSATSITVNTALTLTATVSGAGATPTGTVTLSGASTSSAQTLVNGTYAFSIAANTLSTGSNAFTVNYSGDGNYSSATGTASVTVTASTATFSLSAGAASPSSIAPGGTAVANITVNSATGYGGTVSFTCTQSSGPSNASDDTPECLFTNSAVAVGSSTPFSVLTLPAVSSELKWPNVGGRHSGWSGAGGGAVLALLVFFGIPARRRKWLSMLGMFVALAALGSLAACGGGGGGGTKTTNPGTAAGTYVFTVTGTGTPAPSSAAAPVTFTVVVN